MGNPPQQTHTNSPAPVAENAPPTHWLKSIWDQLRPLIVLVLVMFAARSSLFDWNDVPTGSMKPSILEGDRIFVNKLAYDLKVPFFPLDSTWRIATWSQPKQGEIVVFLKPKDGTRLVKRCIGVPGDTIELRSNRLFINNVECKYGSPDPKYRAAIDTDDQNTYHYLYHEETMPGGRVHPMLEIPMAGSLYNDPRTFGPSTLGPNQFWMMGDNRDNSGDSRVFGPVDRSLILGRAVAIAFSVDIKHSWAPRWSRFFSKLP